MSWKDSTKQKRKAQAEAQGIQIINEPDEVQGDVMVQHSSCSHKRFVRENQIIQGTVGKCPTCRSIEKRDALITQAKAVAKGAQLEPLNVMV